MTNGELLTTDDNPLPIVPRFEERIKMLVPLLLYYEETLEVDHEKYSFF